MSTFREFLRAELDRMFPPVKLSPATCARLKDASRERRRNNQFVAADIRASFERLSMVEKFALALRDKMLTYDECEPGQDADAYLFRIYHNL